jgi:hypothetical protein
MILSTLLAGVAAFTLGAPARSQAGAFVCGTTKNADAQELAKALDDSCDPTRNVTVTGIDSNGYTFQLRFCCIAKAEGAKAESPPQNAPEKR